MISLYLINKAENTIQKVEEKTFNELGFKEREHLQEWLAKKPDALGEELLIIQKEFDGFFDTSERLDLLALDKLGNLVIIENKLDDSGKNVTWQALKYAAYCSTLSKNQIKGIFQQYLEKSGSSEQAENKLVEFFDNMDYEEIALNKGQTQRVILVARSFRKEVTSTVLWLMNYKLRVQCFKVTPFALNDQLFVKFDQIIPLKDTEEYVISMADKTQDDINSQEETKSRYNIRYEFWKLMLKQLNAKSSMFQNVSPSRDNWLQAGSGISGVNYRFVVTNTFARAELNIQRPDLGENKFIYDELLKHRKEVEDAFGSELVWERLDDIKTSRIKWEKTGLSIFDKDDWPDSSEFMIDGMTRLGKAFHNPIKEVNKMLKAKQVL
ncbi:hypothetical protein SDC9_11393 [bioreactor metagenome]|uniref:DUF4268 domain-containing protein n=1 Tax=bioreactor metagenome TaxID=1076179 RepID=A0A644TG99_9ZZZZ|nr:DUF4268 domain-containing protein [Negativicutes bacterium]